jgi:hypothetical protein
LDLWADPPENLKGDVIREQLLSILRKLHWIAVELVRVAAFSGSVIEQRGYNAISYLFE